MSQIINYLKLARINKPTGILLLFLPSLFGIFLSIKTLQDPNISEIFNIISLFFLGSILMRSAGCVINDILDEKFDKNVARTKERPIASGKISRISAIIFTGFLLFLGLLILLQFNFKTILSGFFALILVISYPLMKRITNFPQLFLGITFNFGVLMASLALTKTISFAILLLYFSCIIWTVIYDTIYAFQDIEDDLKIGVKSTAILFKKDPKKILSFLNLIMFVTLIMLGWLESFKAEFFFSILIADLFLNYKIKTCNFDDSRNCLKTFKSNILVGILILIAIILG